MWKKIAGKIIPLTYEHMHHLGLSLTQCLFLSCFVDVALGVSLETGSREDGPTTRKSLK